jgi:DNA-directed RNA polymerase subunit RPC12/RpoP
VDADASHTSEDFTGDETLFFRLCPRCARTVPGKSNERYCINDGQELLERCPVCQARITNPYAQHCGRCGTRFKTIYEHLEITRWS